jgi:hypothetical protein
MLGTFISGWLLLGGIVILDHVSVEVLVQDRFVCSIQCCVPLPFPEYHVSGVVKRPGQWIVYKVLLSQYAVPNEYAGRGSGVQLLSFLFLNVDASQASEHTAMLYRWIPPIPGHIRSLAHYRSHRSAVLEIDLHRDCKRQFVLRKCGIVHHASYAFRDRAVRPFDNSIRLK